MKFFLITLLITLPNVIFSQESSIIKIEEKNLDPSGYFEFYKSNNNFIYYSNSKIYLFENNKIVSSCEFGYSENVIHSFLDESTNTFYILSGFGKIKELGIVDFNQKTPVLTKYKTPIDDYSQSNNPGDYVIKPIDNKKVLISTTGGSRILICELDLISKKITEIYSTEKNNVNSKITYRMEYQTENSLQYVCAKEIFVDGNKKTLQLNRFVFSTANKSMSKISEEKKEIKCEHWFLFTTSNKFYDSKVCTYIAYDNNENKKSSFTYDVQVLDGNEINDNIIVSIDLGDQESNFAHYYKLIYDDDLLHVFEPAKVIIDKQWKEVTMHITADNSSKTEIILEELPQIPVEFLLTKKYSLSEWSKRNDLNFVQKAKYFKPNKESSMTNNCQREILVTSKRFTCTTFVKENSEFVLQIMNYYL
jgi:hypothetical protein